MTVKELANITKQLCINGKGNVQVRLGSGSVYYPISKEELVSTSTGDILALRVDFSLELKPRPVRENLELEEQQSPHEQSVSDFP